MSRGGRLLLEERKGPPWISYYYKGIPEQRCTEGYAIADYWT